jgi:hypothetical protein
MLAEEEALAILRRLANQCWSLKGKLAHATEQEQGGC